MEFMENQHKKQTSDAQMIIDDLNHKIEAMAVSFTMTSFFRIVKLTFEIF